MPVINEIITDSEPQHPRIKETYAEKSVRKDSEISNRKDKVLIARLRSRHHLDFRAYQRRLDPEGGIDPSCPRCEESSKTMSIARPVFLDKLVHWMECDVTMAAKMR